MSGSSRAAFSLIALTIWSGTSMCSAQQRGPSTAPERANAVTMARHLEQEPLEKKAKDARKALFEWWEAVPDLNVSVCLSLLGSFPDSKSKYSKEIMLQLLFSGGVYVIEHPGTAPNVVGVYQAGLEGALRTYQSILRSKPKLRDPFLDQLCEKMAEGTLGSYVTETLPKCKE